MRTLDGLDFTFNGLGEYSLILIEESGEKQFELQGRTQRAVNSKTQQLTNATFYSGFAAHFVGDTRVCSSISLIKSTFLVVDHDFKC